MVLEKEICGIFFCLWTRDNQTFGVNACLEARRLSWKEVCWLGFGCDDLRVLGVLRSLRLTKYFLQVLDGLEGVFMEQYRHFSLQCRCDIVKRCNDGLGWRG